MITSSLPEIMFPASRLVKDFQQRHITGLAAALTYETQCSFVYLIFYVCNQSHRHHR